MLFVVGYALVSNHHRLVDLADLQICMSGVLVYGMHYAIMYYGSLQASSKLHSSMSALLCQRNC